MLKLEIRPLTGLRALAATWVVMIHFTTPRNALVYRSDWFQALAKPVISAGQLGVDLFFVLSGFVLALNYLDRMGTTLDWPGTRSFLWARLARVWPVFFVTMHIAAVIDWLILRSDGEKLGKAFTAQAYFEQLSLSQQWFEPNHAPTWDGPAWTVSCEALAYLLFPIFAVIIFRLALSAGPRLLATLALTAMAPRLLVLLAGESNTSPYNWVLRIMCEFLAGMLAYCWVASIDWTADRRRVAGRMSIFWVVVVVSWLYIAPSTSLEPDWPLMAILFVPLIACLSVGNGPLESLLSTKVLVLGGYISYSLYLIHAPVLDLGTWLGRPIADASEGLYGIYSLLIAASTFVFAWLLWRYVEEPARKTMRAMVAPPVPPSHPRHDAPVAR